MTQRTSRFGVAPGKTRWPGMRSISAWNIFPWPPKWMRGTPMPTIGHGRDHQHVLDDGDPGRAPDPAGEDEGAGQDEGQHDGHVGADRAVARRPRR